MWTRYNMYNVIHLPIFRRGIPPRLPWDAHNDNNRLRHHKNPQVLVCGRMVQEAAQPPGTHRTNTARMAFGQMAPGALFVDPGGLTMAIGASILFMFGGGRTRSPDLGRQMNLAVALWPVQVAVPCNRWRTRDLGHHGNGRNCGRDCMLMNDELVQ